jgi:hypothetical protein
VSPFGDEGGVEESEGLRVGHGEHDRVIADAVNGRTGTDGGDGRLEGHAEPSSQVNHQ